MNIKDTYDINKRFCTDFKVPLKIFDGDIFLKRLELFDVLHIYNRYIKEIEERFSSAQEYLEYYNSVKDKAIDYIKGSAAFQSLNRDDMSKFTCKYNFPQSNVYKDTNAGKKFISIDISKANFTALVHYGNSTGTPFYDSMDYMEWMSEFTNMHFIKQSKYIRQVIFGNCNPKRQVTYEKYLMGTLLENLFSNNKILESDVYSLCSDEIILRADNISFEDYLFLDHFIKNNVDFNVKTEYYTLLKIDGTEAYLKVIYDGAVRHKELKCVNPEEAPFIYRFIKEESFTEDDYIFMHDKKLAKFMEAPQIVLKGIKE